MGQETTFASNTNVTNSWETNPKILEVDAPRTFLIPISLVLCCATKDASPNNPRTAMKTASIEKYPKIVLRLSSERYNRSNVSSRNVYSNGWDGSRAFHFSSMYEIVSEILSGL